eukprot:284776-Amphidinium_carterae.1
MAVKAVLLLHINMWALSDWITASKLVLRHALWRSFSVTALVQCPICCEGSVNQWANLAAGVPGGWTRILSRPSSVCMAVSASARAALIVA